MSLTSEVAVGFLHSASPLGMIHVFSYTPGEGVHGDLISVRIDFNGPVDKPAFVRLVVGNKALATQVSMLSDTADGKWQLRATVPHLHESTTTPLTVQALTPEDHVIDSVTFGSFRYLNSAVYGDRSENTRHQGNVRTPGKPAPRRPTGSRSHSSSSNSKGASSSIRQNKSSTTHNKHKLYLMRRKPSGEDNDASDQKAILEILSPLENFARGWDESEFRRGRRLIRFTRIFDGRKLIVSCERINQEDHREQDTVISCIYRPSCDDCVVTSVDIIYLLENLVGCDFEVEEKNRIRRNLEGLKPTTVSKVRPDSHEFYQRIMDFPEPQPRKIEKDLKVFEWKLLGPALEKIVSRYSLYSSPSDDSEASSSEESPATRSATPDVSNIGWAQASDGRYPHDTLSDMLPSTGPRMGTACPPTLPFNPDMSNSQGSEWMMDSDESNACPIPPLTFDSADFATLTARPPTPDTYTLPI